MRADTEDGRLRPDRTHSNFLLGPKMAKSTLSTTVHIAPKMTHLYLLFQLVISIEIS